MRHPAALPAFALLAGSAVGALLIPAFIPALAIGLVAAWIASLVSFTRRAGRVFAASVTVGFCLAGAALTADAESRALLPWLRVELERHPGLVGGREPVRLEGRLARDAAPTDFGASLDVEVERVLIDGAAQPARGGVRLSVGGELVAGSIGAWRAGRAVRVWALLREPVSYRNPGNAGANERRRLARQGTTLVGSVKSARMVEVVTKGGRIGELLADGRAYVRAAVARHVGRRSAESAGIITAILIGDRAGLTDEVERRLQDAGTYHVIAISGGNIAILAGVLLTLLRLARCPPRAGAALSIAGLAAYAALVGDEASVVRATLVAVLYLGARLLDHRAPPLNSLGAAAGLILAASPLAIFDAGFALSFGATAAILLGVPRVTAWIRQACERRKRTAPRWLLAAAGLLAATLSAELALLPLSAWWFSRVTFAGLVLNFLAIPLLTVAQLAGMAVLALARVSGWLADRAGDLAWLAAAGLVDSARGVDLAPWLVRRVPAPPAVLMVVYYAGWVVWLAGRGPALARRAALSSVAIAGILIVTAPPAPDLTARRGWLRVTFLDVAQGDATLLRFPDGRALLVDAGGTPGGRFDIGGRIVAPALWRLGVRRLEALAITHADPDHIGGALAVVRDFHPRAIWEGVPVPRDAAQRELEADAAARAIEWRQLRAGDRLRVGGVEIRTLHPPPPDWERQQVRNDDSLVLDVRLGDVSILMTGDIGRDVERDLIARLEPASLRVLKVPHHGSATSSTAAFIAAAGPAVAIVSAGKGNLFGHPAQAVLARYRAAGVEVLRTDEDGAITVETDGRSVEITTWTGRRITIQAR